MSPRRPRKTRTRWIVGCMTGTSLDGLDLALTQIRGEQLDVRACFAGSLRRPLGTLASDLRHFAGGNPAPPIDYRRAARQLGALHADAAAELCDKHLPAQTTVDLVAAHGQTIWHSPHDRAGPLSWQLFDPWPIVRRLHVPVCFDLRQADLIAGGQGAPITPIADRILFANEADLVVNLGGICNITSLAPSLDGLDVCPCNLLIDRVVQMLFPQRGFDQNGILAAAGSGDSRIFGPLFKELPFYQKRRRTLGREDFSNAAIAALLDPWRPRCSGQDLIASAVEAVAETVADGLARFGYGRVILAGGGARNPVLVERIRHHCGTGATIRMSDELGIPCEAREAVCMAILGALSQDGVPITQARVTGADAPGRAGTWAYP